MTASEIEMLGQQEEPKLVPLIMGMLPHVIIEIMLLSAQFLIFL